MTRNSKVTETEIKSNKDNGKAPTGKLDHFGGLTKDELMNVLRLMYTSRQIDNKSHNLIKQGKGFFHLAAGGHEATQIAFGLAMDPKKD